MPCLGFLDEPPLHFARGACHVGHERLVLGAERGGKARLQRLDVLMQAQHVTQALGLARPARACSGEGGDEAHLIAVDDHALAQLMDGDRQAPVGRLAGLAIALGDAGENVGFTGCGGQSVRKRGAGGLQKRADRVAFRQSRIRRDLRGEKTGCRRGLCASDEAGVPQRLQGVLCRLEVAGGGQGSCDLRGGGARRLRLRRGDEPQKAR